MALLDEYPLLILDGACGTNLQEKAIPSAAWRGCEGCNELLNLTAAEVVCGIHRDFLDAGARVLETNTFGASRIVLAEYGLEGSVAEINRAAVENARRAIGALSGRHVAGSIGPSTKLPSLGHVSADEMEAAYAEQARALLEAGADCLILETCQDLLQIKTALSACLDAREALGREAPILVSVTVERTGTLLVGSDIAAVAATLEPFPIFSLGLNCGTGPADMESHLRYLCAEWPGRVSCIPNQGLPEVVDGRTAYRLSPAEYAQRMRRFVEEWGVSVVGGCCGTTPAHIRRLCAELDGVVPGRRVPS